MRLAIALLLVSGVVFAGSPPPSPSTGKQSGSNQEHTASNTAKPQGDSASPQQPAPSLNLNHTPGANWQSANGEEKTQQNFSQEWWRFSDSNSVIAWLTIVLAASAVVQLIASFLQWWSMRQQGKLTEQGIELTSQEFFSSHRPKIHIRDVRFITEGLAEMDRTRVGFTVVNVGETVALFAEVRAELEFREKDHPNRTADPEQIPLIDNQIGLLKSGERRPCIVAIETPSVTVFDVLRKGTLQGPVKFCLSGAVFYESVALEVKYCTRFTWEYDDAKGSWVQPQDPEENYED